MDSRSVSEGEIIESTESKANTTTRFSRDTTVDPPSRQYTPASVSSRISERSRGDRDRSRSPYRRNRDPSRSPFRHSRNKSPRGEKRRRDRDDFRDRADNRRHRAHYEDDRSGNRPTGPRAPISYADLDHNDQVGSARQVRGDGSNHFSRDGGPFARTNHTRYDRRSRDRSRSPEVSSRRGFNQKQDKYNRQQRADGYGGRGSNGARAGLGYQGSRDQYMNDRDGYTRNALVQDKPSQNGASGIQKPSSIATEPGSTNSKSTDPPAPIVPELDFTEPVVEDEASIEAMRAEKKRKREAIRARLAAQNGSNQPLLQQVLVGSTSDPSTPTVASPSGLTEKSVSPPAGSPDVQMQDSTPASPAGFVVANEEKGEDHDTVDAQEASAANYDPTMDMEEDRARATRNQELSSSAYDETNPETRQVLLPAPQPEEPAPKQVKKEFDMFAEDDDDMFAEDDTANNDTTKAATIPQGRQLDQSMLDNWDDEQGYYRVYLNELLDGERYQVKEVLGKGVFANVVRANDKATSDLVAIKVVRKNDSMRKAGYKEIGFLKKLLEADPEDKKHTVRFRASFEHKGHLCMVFENLSMNLRDLLKTVGGGHGISLKAVKEYAKQMFLGLVLLKKCNILHADLKPDNILVSMDQKSLKICDLGSAADVRDNNEITPYLVSRFYRAPEIILGMKFDYAIDMWSIGCTIFELWTGRILFTGPTNNQMLKSIMDCRGRFSLKYLKKGELSGNHFNEKLEFCSREKDTFGKDIVRWLTISAKPKRDLKTRVFDAAKDIKNGPNVAELTQFVDLLDKCLNMNAEKRITPADALRHPFFAPKSAVTKAPVTKHRMIGRPI